MKLWSADLDLSLMSHMVWGQKTILLLIFFGETVDMFNNTIYDVNSLDLAST